MKPAGPNPEVENLVRAAEAALQTGDGVEARSRFRSVLTLEPRHAVAHYWLGVLALKAGSPEEAVGHLETAARERPEFPDFHIDLSLAYRALNRPEESEASLNAGRRAAPTYSQEQLRLAETLARQEKLEGAIEACQRGLTLFPNEPRLLQKLADLHLQARRWPDALRVWQTLLQARPDCAATCLAFGEACYQAGEFELAIDAYERALALQPETLNALLNLGLACQELGRHERALSCFQRGLEIDPNQAQIHKVLGDLHREMGRWPEANLAWKRAVEIQPNYADAWQNLGLGLERENQLEAALACHERVVRLQPRNATGHRYLGMIRQDLGQWEAARTAYLEALRLRPKDPETHWQLFSLLAAQGEFPQAWTEYEWRWKIKGRTTPKREFTKPAWDGGDLQGRAILVYSEQGFGDTIQAVRYVPLLQARGARVLLWCPPELVSLLTTVPGVSEVLSQLTKAALFDVHAPLMSLPGLFGTALETVPAQVPYLRGPTDHPLARALPTTSQLKVGLVWCGSLSQPNDRRPVPFQALAPLLDREDVTFLSLQTGPASADLQHPPISSSRSVSRVIDLGAQLTDFAATAAVIERLDLVITVDTAVAHLAGALGKPVWVLISFAPDWRWLRDREDNPWYPTMRLFRQTKPGDWTAVIERVSEALSERATSLSEKALGQQRVRFGVPPSGGFSVGPPEGGTPCESTQTGTKATPGTSSVKTWLGMGLAHHQAGQLAEAEQQYRRILEIEPDHADAWRFLGVLERQRGRFEAARSCLEKAVANQPDSAQIHHDLGLVWIGIGRTQEAIRAYRRALELQPQFPDAHYNLGNACFAAGRFEDAAASYRRALEQQPDLADAHFNLGLLAHQTGQRPKALEQYEAALKVQPRHTGALLSLGLAFKEAGQFRKAEAEFRKILEFEPANAQATINLASVLTEQARKVGQPDELKRAEELCLAVLETQARLPEAWVNLGVIRQALGEVDRAIACFQRALELQPENADARYNLGIAELLLGRYETGWQNYEARWRTANPVFAPRGFAPPRWEGQNLSGRTLLVHAEQGLGDTIQFVRFLSALPQPRGRVILECPPSLKRLMGTVAGVTEVISRGQALPPCDYQIPLLSLPRCLHVGLAAIPNRVPYLKVPPGVKGPVPSTPETRLKVGIAWAGNPHHGSDRSRSLSPAALSPLLELEATPLYSLQVGPASLQERESALAGKMVDLGPQLTDFAVTAAAIAQLDLVISVDTAVAHLAGALAKPVWVLLPFAPDWRWLLHRDDSPWYPTMRLFRQQTHGDWAGVIERVVAALEKQG